MGDAVLRELGVNNGARIVFDRSRVRILVCDPSLSPDVVDLLRRCSYQVVAVQNARQVMEVLRQGIGQVDLILAEVELPNKKGFKMLKYFMREEQLKQIPIVMMSSRDEMAVVGKCLRLGAADYLVKPLRTNELLNLWTHMWRRRRMLGMTEKCLLSGSLNPSEAPLDILFADTSESNTEDSTDLFSEDSKDQARRSVMDGANSRLASRQDQALRNTLDGANSKLASRSGEPGSPPVLELTLMPSSDAATVEHSPKSDCIPSPPKKTELKSAESSAFLSYDKVSNREIKWPKSRDSRHVQVNDGPKYRKSVQTLGMHERSSDRRHKPRPGGSDAHMATHKAVQSISLVDSRRVLPSSLWESLNRQPSLPLVSAAHKHQSFAQTHRGSDRSSEWQTTHALHNSDAHLPSHPTLQGVPPVEMRVDQATAPWEMGNSRARPLIHNMYMGTEGLPSNGWSGHNQMRTRYPDTPVEQTPMMQMHIQNESLMGVPTIPPFGASHHLPPNMVAPNMHSLTVLSPSLHLYCGLESPMGLSPGIAPMHMVPPGHAIAPPAAYSFYPLSVPVGQPPHIWPAMLNAPVSEHKLERAERREAALSKFRQKRKDRCFEKKIRYVSRKRLAEQRPRNRGQFVRRGSSSGMCGSVGVDESDDEDDEEENISSCHAVESYPENRVSHCVSLG